MGRPFEITRTVTLAERNGGEIPLSHAYPVEFLFQTLIPDLSPENSSTLFISEEMRQIFDISWFVVFIIFSTFGRCLSTTSDIDR